MWGPARSHGGVVPVRVHLRGERSADRLPCAVGVPYPHPQDHPLRLNHAVQAELPGTAGRTSTNVG